MQHSDPFQLRCHLHHLWLSSKLGCALKQTKKRPKKSVLWAEPETFNHLSPPMTCAVSAFTYTTSLDQSQCQVLMKGKQEMKLELLNRRWKVLMQGWVSPLQPLVPGEALALRDEKWHWMRMGYTCLDTQEGQSQPSKEIWNTPTPLLLGSWIQDAEKMGRERKYSF